MSAETKTTERATMARPWAAAADQLELERVNGLDWQGLRRPVKPDPQVENSADSLPLTGDADGWHPKTCSKEDDGVPHESSSASCGEPAPGEQQRVRDFQKPLAPSEPDLGFIFESRRAADGAPPGTLGDWQEVIPISGVGPVPLASLARDPSGPTPHFVLCPSPGAEGLYAPIDAPGGERGDSGTDVRFAADVLVPHGSALDGFSHSVSLGVRARCLVDGAPRPYLLFPRSSLGKTPLSLANAVGLVDAGYTGELRVALRNHSARDYAIARGTSLFQLVCPGFQPATVSVVGPDDPLFAEGASARGGQGYGSTGAEGRRQ